MDMQMKSHLQWILCACTCVVSASAMADVRVTIDALQNCIDTTSISGGKATVSLEPGRYVASLIANTMACRGGPPTPSCRIDKVILQTTADQPVPKQVYWGLVVQDPVVVDIPGPASANVFAFVLDPQCNDNYGTATLRFQLAK